MSTKRVSDYARFFEDDDDVVHRLLETWEPGAPGQSEKNYEAALYGWLTHNLQDVPMTAQYGIAKAKADIVVEDRHVIELKLGFRNASDLNRCIGQLETYRSKWVDPSRGPVFLVLVGDSDPEFRAALYRWFCKTSAELFQTWFYICEIRSDVKGAKRFWRPAAEV